MSARRLTVEQLGDQLADITADVIARIESCRIQLGCDPAMATKLLHAIAIEYATEQNEVKTLVAEMGGHSGHWCCRRRRNTKQAKRRAAARRRRGAGRPALMKPGQRRAIQMFKVELTDWERQKLSVNASVNALTYAQHHAKGGLFDHEIEEMHRWNALATKLAARPDAAAEVAK